ncbi:MAG: hypothetical protein U0670_10710 [Anaerolineae bacterium]
MPKPYFDTMTIEKRRDGGTTICLKMIVMGQTFHYHQVVSEPEPGHVIVETQSEYRAVVALHVRSAQR